MVVVVLDSFFVTVEEPFLVVVVVVVVVVTTVVTIVVESSKLLSSFDKAGLNGHQFAFPNIFTIAGINRGRTKTTYKSMPVRTTMEISIKDNTPDGSKAAKVPLRIITLKISI